MNIKRAASGGVRRATFSGSWYSSDPNKLRKQIDEWLGESLESTITPKNPVKAIIAPHAGYSYSGRTAAYSYSGLIQSKERVKTIFLLGPSHYHHFLGCGIPCVSVTQYETPFGPINLNMDILDQLFANKKMFCRLDISIDEAEHSLEMHLPYVQHIMQGSSFTLVPLMFGHLNKEMTGDYGSILAPYLCDENTFFIVSSDFCHWGAKFQYTRYDSKFGEICDFIQVLDQLGMDAIESGDPKIFNKYLLETKNTICGRTPILVLLEAIYTSPIAFKTKFIRYEQSNPCKKFDDTSVSYAAGIVEIIIS